MGNREQEWSYTNGAQKTVRMLVTKSSMTTGSYVERLAVSEVGKLGETGAVP